MILAAAIAAGCGPSGPTVTPALQSATEPPFTAEPLTPEPGLESAGPTDEPEPTEDPADTDEPAPADEPEPAETPASGSVAACSGTDENRDFFSAVAAAVSWPVYCPALPRGWNVESGQYRLASGGRMEISYRGPDGAGLRLQEGAFCESGGCLPTGDEIGGTAFGDRDGSLYEVADGWAVAVDGGEPISWLLVVTGVSERRARTFAANLVRVED